MRNPMAKLFERTRMERAERPLSPATPPSPASPYVVNETLPTDIVREIVCAVAPENVVIQAENDIGSLALVTRTDLPPGMLRITGRPVGVPFGAAGIDLDIGLWQAPILATAANEAGQVVYMRAGRTAFVAAPGPDFVPEVIPPDQWHWPENIISDKTDARHLNVIIEAPIGVALRLASGSGNIEVQTAASSSDIALACGSGTIRVNQARANGVIYALCGSGNVSASDLRSPLRVELRSGSGGVQLKGVASPAVVLSSKSGNVRLADHTWTPEGALLVAPVLLALRSGSGSIEVEGAEATELHLESGSGSITYRGQCIAQQKCVIHTGSGSIRLHLNSASAAEIAARTRSGRLRLDLATERFFSVIREQTQTSFAGRLGGGGQALDIDSGSGSITIAVE